MTIRIKTPKDMNGPRALITAVIAQAVNDARGYAGREYVRPARAYFSSEAYRQHMTWLELPPEWLPEGFETTGLPLSNVKK